VRLSRAALALFLTAGIAGAVSSASGAAQSPAFPPLDIAVVLDQSGSLSGFGGAVPSDPNNVRVDAVKTLIETLSSYSAAADTRFALVEFGSVRAQPATPRIAVPLAQVQSGAVSTMISQVQAKNLGGTDFRSALCLTWLTLVGRTDLPGSETCAVQPSELAKIPLAPNLASRRRVAILFTDGFPAPAGEDLDFSSSDPADCGTVATAGVSSGHRYMCDVAGLWARLNGTLPEGSRVELRVIGLDASGQWWPRAERYWRLIAGCTTQCGQQVTQVVNPEAIVDELVGQALTTPGDQRDICATSCTVSPGIMEARFVVRARSASHLVDPGGNEANASTAGVTVSNSTGLEIWRVTAPDPGTWRVMNSDPNANLKVQLIQSAGRLRLHAAPEQPIAQDPFEVSAQVVNDSGDGVITLPPRKTPYTITLALSSSDGSIDRREVTGVVDTVGNRFRFQPALTAPKPGEYTLVAELTVGGDRLAIGSTKIEVQALPDPTVTLVRNGGTVDTEVFAPRLGYPFKVSGPGELRLSLLVGNDQVQNPTNLKRWFVTDPPPRARVSLQVNPPCHLQVCEVTIDEPLALGNGHLDIQRTWPEGWNDSLSLTATATVTAIGLGGEPWSHASAPLPIKARRPPWAAIWAGGAFGYWLPFLVLLSAVVALSAVHAHVAKPLPNRRYSELVALAPGASGFSAIRRFGGLGAWQLMQGKSGSSVYLLAPSGLVAGALTLRAIPNRAALRSLQDYTGRASRLGQVASIVRLVLLGVRPTSARKEMTFTPPALDKKQGIRVLVR
jgi:hypothetical protein